MEASAETPKKSIVVVIPSSPLTNICQPSTHLPTSKTQLSNSFTKPLPFTLHRQPRSKALPRFGVRHCRLTPRILSFCTTLVFRNNAAQAKPHKATPKSPPRPSSTHFPWLSNHRRFHNPPATSNGCEARKNYLVRLRSAKRKNPTPTPRKGEFNN